MRDGRAGGSRYRPAGNGGHVAPTLGKPSGCFVADEAETARLSGEPMSPHRPRTATRIALAIASAIATALLLAGCGLLPSIELPTALPTTGIPAPTQTLPEPTRTLPQPTRTAPGIGGRAGMPWPDLSGTDVCVKNHEYDVH